MKVTSTDALKPQAQFRAKNGWEAEASTMRMISTMAVAALIVVLTTLLRSRSSSIEPAPLQELNTIVGVNKLPSEDFEGILPVYFTVTKR